MHIVEVLNFQDLSYNSWRQQDIELCILHLYRLDLCTDIFFHESLWIWTCRLPLPGCMSIFPILFALSQHTGSPYMRGPGDPVLALNTGSASKLLSMPHVHLASGLCWFYRPSMPQEPKSVVSELVTACYYILHMMGSKSFRESTTLTFEHSVAPGTFLLYKSLFWGLNSCLYFGYQLLNLTSYIGGQANAKSQDSLHWAQ